MKPNSLNRAPSRPAADAPEVEPLIARMERGRRAPASPLAGSRVGCMLPVKDLVRARRFYEHQLALEPVGARPDGKFGYRCGDSEIWLLPRPEGTKAEHTALGFCVHDIEGAVAELRRRNVRFADYDLPGLRTVNHVALTGSEKAAWFEDTEGNFLCLHEDLD